MKKYYTLTEYNNAIDNLETLTRNFYAKNPDYTTETAIMILGNWEIQVGYRSQDWKPTFFATSNSGAVIHYNIPNRNFSAARLIDYLIGDYVIYA